MTMSTRMALITYKVVLFMPSACAAVLPPGAYTLSVNFTPADTTLYRSASGSVLLVVNKALPAYST